MADRPHTLKLQALPQPRYDAGGAKGFTEQGPSTIKVLAVLAGVPLGGTLLALAGLALMGSLIGLAVATPLFIIFSPVLVPAAITVGLAVAGFLTSEVLAWTALSSLTWMLGFLRQVMDAMPGQLGRAKGRMADIASFAGQKTKETGHEIQSKADEARR